MSDRIDLAGELDALARDLGGTAGRSAQEQQWDAAEREMREGIRTWVNRLVELFGEDQSVSWLMERVPWPVDDVLRYPPAWMRLDAFKQLSRRELLREIWLHDVRLWIWSRAHRGITPEQTVQEHA